MTTEQPQTAPSPRLLRRRATDRVIGGVAAGIADYLNIDPVLVRAVFVGLVVFGGAGVVLYLGDLAPDSGRRTGRVTLRAGAAARRAAARSAAHHRRGRVPLPRRLSVGRVASTSTAWMLGILRAGGDWHLPAAARRPGHGHGGRLAGHRPGNDGRCGRTHRRRGTAILCRAATAGSPFAAGLVHHRRHPDRHRRGSPARTDLQPGPAAGPVLRPGADGDRRGPAHRLVVGTRPRADPARAVGVAAGPPGRVHDGAAGGRCRRPVLRADEHGGARRSATSWRSAR